MKTFYIFPAFIILTLFFVILKASGAVLWSWWVVFSPILIIFGTLAAGIFLGGLTLAAFIGTLTRLRK